MAGRPLGSGKNVPLTNEHRLKIANSNILSALIAHAEGTKEMSASQVQAGLGLLKKVLPDLSNTQVSGDDGGPVEIVMRWAEQQKS